MKKLLDFNCASVVLIVHSILFGSSIEIGFSSIKEIVTSKFSLRVCVAHQ